MATLDRPLKAARIEEYPEGSVRFDLWMSLLSLWFIAGLFVDGWAHNHGATDNTFFTPWHALLYSGIGASGVFLIVHQYRNILKGHVWSRALPKGYLISLFGVPLFFIAGAFDFLWHEIFGFEANIETLLSPAHLLLALSGMLIMTGTLRAAWARREAAPGWRGLFPVVLSLTLILSAITFFNQFSNMFTQVDFITGRTPPPNTGLLRVLGVATFLIPIPLMIGSVMFAVRRWRLPFGAVAFIFTVNAVGMLVLQWADNRPYWYVVAAAMVGGLVGDVLLRQYVLTRDRAWLRAFGFFTPLVLTLVYFALLIATVGVWWTVHVWLGVAFFGGAAGIMLSYVAVPPPLPEGVEV